MTMQNFDKELCDYILSGYALLYVDTHEKDRAIGRISDIAAALKKNVAIWSISYGWMVSDTASPPPPNTSPIESQLGYILQMEPNTICILKDFGFYVSHDTNPSFDVVISTLDDIRKIIVDPEFGHTIVFVGPDFKVPTQLLNEITHLDFDLPNEDELSQIIQEICNNVVNANGEKFVPQLDKLEMAVRACKGMTAQQASDRIALALRTTKDLGHDAIESILKEKAAIIKLAGTIEYTEPPPGGLSNIGGYENIKEHILIDRTCSTQQANDFGIEFPKGLMLVGVPGCGKTRIAECIASELQMPLISMDVGNLMSKYVGDSEKNMRDAIKIINRVSPCVLMLDEIEKGFGGAGDQDGGASQRVFGTFLKWLSDRKTSVYVVATANRVESLPPEFCRKGRFDEIYGLDLPNQKERADIFAIHLKKRNQNVSLFDLDRLAADTDGYTGADIEQAIKLGLKIAFINDKTLDMESLLNGIKDVIPLSKTEAERITKIREWCKLHSKQASTTNTTKSVASKMSRKVSLN